MKTIAPPQLIPYYVPARPIGTLGSADTILSIVGDGSNWVGEPKINDSRAVIYFGNLTVQVRFTGRKYQCQKSLMFNRHGELMKVPQELQEKLDNLNLPDGTVLDTGLMHFKTKDVKNTLVIFDILVYGDKQFFQTPLRDRLKFRSALVKEINDPQIIELPVFRKPIAMIEAFNRIKNQPEPVQLASGNIGVCEGLVLKTLSSGYPQNTVNPNKEFFEWVRQRKELVR